MKKLLTIKFLIIALFIVIAPISAMASASEFRTANWFEVIRERWAAYQSGQESVKIEDEADQEDKYDVEEDKEDENSDEYKEEDKAKKLDNVEDIEENKNQDEDEEDRRVKSKIDDFINRIDDTRSRFDEDDDLQEDFHDLRYEFVRYRESYDQSTNKTELINQVRNLVLEQKTLEKKLKQDVYIKNLHEPLEAVQEAINKVNKAVNSLEAKGFSINETWLATLSGLTQEIDRLENVYNRFVNNPDSVTRADVDAFKKDVNQLKNNLQILVQEIRANVTK